MEPDRRMDAAVSHLKHLKLEKADAVGISQVLADLFGLEQGTMSRIVNRLTNWADKSMTTPDWKDLKSWFMQEPNAEVGMSGDLHDVKQVKTMRFLLEKNAEWGEDVLTEMVGHLVGRTGLYLEVSSEYQLSYFVDSVRIPLVDYFRKEFQERLKSLKQDLRRPASSNSLGIFKSALEAHLKYATERFGSPWTLRLPLVLADVVSRCSRKEDIVSKAIELRSTGKAKRFRKWLRRLESIYCNPEPGSGKKSLGKGENVVKKLGEARKELETLPFEGPRLDSLVIDPVGALNPAALAKATAEYSTNFLGWLTRYFKFRRLHYLHNLQSRVSAIVASGAEIEELFGLDVSDINWHV